MTIKEIYTTYSIPQNLQEHMLRVAAMGSIICQNVQNITIDTNLIVKTLLLHDMGNIIKFDFSMSHFLSAMDQERIDYLKKIQKEFVEKYGEDVNAATKKIIIEITTDQRILHLFENSKGDSIKDFIDGEEWDRKISYYCDMRVGPLGVVTLGQRFDDLKDRYAMRDTMLQQRYCFLDGYRNRCSIIEQQIQSIVSIRLRNINDTMVNKEIEKIKDTVFLINPQKLLKMR